MEHTWVTFKKSTIYCFIIALYVIVLMFFFFFIKPKSNVRLLLPQFVDYNNFCFVVFFIVTAPAHVNQKETNESKVLVFVEWIRVREVNNRRPRWPRIQHTTANVWKQLFVHCVVQTQKWNEDEQKKRHKKQRRMVIKGVPWKQTMTDAFYFF